MGAVENDNWYNIALGGECGPVKYGSDNPVSKPVYQFDMKGNLIACYSCRAELEKYGFKSSKISGICNKNAREAHSTYYFRGYVFADTSDYIFKKNMEEVTEVDENGKRHATETTKLKIAKKSKGFHHTAQSKEKLRQSHLGRTLSQESRKKISAHRKGKLTGANNPNYQGKAMTEEHYKAHSKFMKGKHMSPKTEFTSEKSSGAKNSQARPIVRLSLHGKLLQTYGYLGEAGKDSQFPSDESIRACCKGRQRTYKGYRWMYLEDYEKMKGGQNDSTC